MVKLHLWLFLQPYPSQYKENYSDSSICVDAVSSIDCSTYGISFCAVQETYTINGSNRYALQLESMYIHLLLSI